MRFIGVGAGLILMVGCGERAHQPSMTDIEAIQQNNTRAGAPDDEPSGWFWQNPLPTGAWLQAVAAIDKQTAVAVGFEGTILRTGDGGETWTLQPSGTRNWLRGIAFADANIGVAVGDVGTILRTIDGGATWASQPSGTSNGLYGASFGEAT